MPSIREAVAAGPSVPACGRKLIMPLTGSPASDVTVPNTAMRAGPSAGAQPLQAAVAHASKTPTIREVLRHLCDTPPAFNIGPSEFTSDLAAGFGRQGLKGREIDAVADESHRAVEQLEVPPAGMVRPEMEVVIAVGQPRSEPEFRRHQVVAVPFAVNVSEAADVEPPIEVVGNPPFAHRERIGQAVRSEERRVGKE